MNNANDGETRVTFGFREGMQFGFGFAVPMLALYVVIVLTLLYVVP